MLAFVPVAFDAYRPLKPRLRWAMQCLVSFADRAGRCFPSVRKLAAFAGLSKSAVSRHLRDLVECGAITRQRRSGRGYKYEVMPQFLPRAPVSHLRSKGVPPQATQETDLGKQTKARARPRFADRRVSFSETPDPADRWQARIRSWIRSGGQFWLADWGPKPNEPGCWAPAALLQTGS
jgi:DNA-binding transcriptional ArsR family regulator